MIVPNIDLVTIGNHRVYNMEDKSRRLSVHIQDWIIRRMLEDEIEIYGYRFEGEFLSRLFEFTLVLRNPSQRNGSQLLNIDTISYELEWYLSKTQYPKRWSKKQNKPHRPFLFLSYDAEGSRGKQVSDTNEFIHCHGIIKIHANMAEAFISKFKRDNANGRLILDMDTSAKYAEYISMKPLGEVEETVDFDNFVKYCIKLDTIKKYREGVNCDIRSCRNPIYLEDIEECEQSDFIMIALNNHRKRILQA